MARCFCLAFALSAPGLAEKPEDRVLGLPGFPEASTWGFKAYSGFLDVPGPIAGYDQLRIHYQFHTSQRDPRRDPIATWHQGGPGGSSINIGLYGEMGAFQVGDEAHGNYLNPYAWNKILNMLYLDSPAGSGASIGYSQCVTKQRPVLCEWDDRSQAEAYAHTLVAFLDAFQEFATNDIYLLGESYFGQYGPNIADFILGSDWFRQLINLKGIAAGNACWGGTETCVACNGPSQDKLDVELFFGKGLFSPKLKKEIDETCNFPTQYKSGQGGFNPFDCDAGSGSAACNALLETMREEVGPHNVYNIYDDCPNTVAFLERTGRSMGWLTAVLRAGLHNATATSQTLRELNGGYAWDCGGDVASWITSPPVRKALHLDATEPGVSKFAYKCSGPASITLWPRLVRQLRVLIYNGDADACVPYNGNEAWIAALEARGDLVEAAPWKPWFAGGRGSPAGYITRYQAPATNVDFSFATIRLAGHMAPQFRPEASLAMLKGFIDWNHIEIAV